MSQTMLRIASTVWWRMSVREYTFCDVKIIIATNQPKESLCKLFLTLNVKRTTASDVFAEDGSMVPDCLKERLLEDSDAVSVRLDNSIPAAVNDSNTGAAETPRGNPYFHRGGVLNRH